MRYIITEKQNKLIIQVFRRLLTFEKLLNDYIETDYPCYYDSKKDYIDIIIRACLIELLEIEVKEDFDEELISLLTSIYGERLSKKYDDAECDED